MKIYLIGMPGVGKSKTGHKVSEKLGYRFVDLDNRIEQQYGPISDIFASFGEDYFRNLETKTLKNLANSSNTVISCGGGIILRKENKEIMKNGVVIFLDGSIELIKEHVEASDKRPLLKTKSVEELYNERIYLYNLFADYTLKYENYDDASDKIVNFIKSKPEIKKVLVINGPNLNMLGQRDPNHYGKMTLNDINDLMKLYANFKFDFFQSNHEGLIIDKIQTYAKYDAIIINPGAYTHTSLAIADALEIASIPKVEVHLSDINNREEFRKIDFIRPNVDIMFAGEKENSYLKATNYLKSKLNML